MIGPLPPSLSMRGYSSRFVLLPAASEMRFPNSPSVAMGVKLSPWPARRSTAETIVSTNPSNPTKHFLEASAARRDLSSCRVRSLLSIRGLRGSSEETPGWRGNENRLGPRGNFH